MLVEESYTLVVLGIAREKSPLESSHECGGHSRKPLYPIICSPGIAVMMLFYFLENCSLILDTSFHNAEI